MDLGLSGKRVIVMGASMGIGRGIAKSLIDEGAKVAICSRSEKKISEAQKTLGASFSFSCDLSQKGEATRFIEAVTKEFGGVDAIVFNSGGPDTGNFLDISLEKWEESFQVVWRHLLEGLQIAIPKMKQQAWGRMVVITSVAAKEPVSGLTISNAFRSGILGLINSVSKEIASDGITINAIMPGYVRTERLGDLHIREEELVKNVPAKRLGEPKDIGALAAFLCSDKASYITGQAIACDGGYLKSI